MKPTLKLTYSLFIILLIGAWGCQKNNPEELLSEAKNKFFKGQVSYITEAHFPVPDTKLVNKTFYATDIRYIDTQELGYEFYQTSDEKDILFENNELKIVYHDNKKTQVLQPKHFKDDAQFINVSGRQFKRKKWSPLGLLDNQDWQFEKDTLIEKVNHRNFKRIIFDSIVEGITVRTEQHIFIDPQALLTRFERRNFQDGKNSQTLTFIYSDYKMSEETRSFEFEVPSDYLTEYGIIKKNIKQVNEGDMATLFQAKTMEGKAINTSDFKGKKYILNFSVINCGNCKASLDYMNQEDYTYNKDIPMLYINPEDTDENMKIYREDIAINMPVITDAASIAQDFGVTSFPRFFLIDENGKIEKIVKGHSTEFLDEISL